MHLFSYICDILGKISKNFIDMKRLFLALGLCLLSGLFFSCTEKGNDSVASFSKEIRADDPVTIRLYDTYTLADDAQTVEAARKAISISPHVDFDVQVVDGQTTY